jgi:hypothetical protein
MKYGYIPLCKCISAKRNRHLAWRHPEMYYLVMARPFVPLRFIVVGLFFAIAAGIAVAQDLPKKSDKPDFDFEPKLMLNDLPDLPQPAIDPSKTAETAPPLDVARLEAELEKAKKNASWRERLYKAGALSRVEAEQSALKIVRITKDLETARQQALARKVEETKGQSEKDASAKTAATEAESALAAATAAAQAASAKWEEAQRAAAELRLERERKLLAAGAGSRSSVKRAEAALQAIAPVPGGQ